MRERSTWRVSVTDWRNRREASSVPPVSSRASTAWVWARPGRTISWVAAKISASRLRIVGPFFEQQVDIGAKHLAKHGGRLLVSGCEWTIVRNIASAAADWPLRAR